MESDEEDDEEFQQLEEMRPPVLTSWMGPDGIKVPGIMCVDDGIIRLKNRCQLDDCAICYKPSTTHGKHQICCLPCGHTYGFSCIKKWLLLGSSSGKCPQCNTFCSFQDALLLYPTRLCVTAHQKASSARLFPFTEQGSLEFEKYENSRMLDAKSLRDDDKAHMNILERELNELAERRKELARQSDNLLTRAESVREADALQRRASLLEPRVEALRRRMDALEQRSDAFESRICFYLRMYEEEHRKREEEIAKAKRDFERKKKLAEKSRFAFAISSFFERAAAKAKKKGEKEAEEAAKLKDKEKKEDKKMQASGTVDVPEDKMVEDAAEKPEEDKVEVKEKPTTKTMECVRVRSKRNIRDGPDSISKVYMKT